MIREEVLIRTKDELLKDERLYYPTANIFINAPLALIQLQLATTINVYETILEIPLTNFF